MKKKILKIIFGVITVFASLALISGCGLFGENEKTFEKEGMQITLTSYFNEIEAEGQTVAYESRTAVATALKERFSSYQGLASMTVEDYAETSISYHNLSGSKVLSREGKSYVYFTYEKSDSGQSFFLLATVHKTDDAFWLIQFACIAGIKNTYTEIFLKWADSVTFTETSGGTSF